MKRKSESGGILDTRKKTVRMRKDVFHAYQIPKKVLAESQIEGLIALKQTMKK